MNYPLKMMWGQSPITLK